MLHIDNISDGSVAFKIKTTAPKIYVVKPNQAFLDKGQKITINIELRASTPGQPVEQFLKEYKVETNKFLIEVAKSNYSSSEGYALTTFWENI